MKGFERSNSCNTLIINILISLLFLLIFGDLRAFLNTKYLCLNTYGLIMLYGYFI